MRNRSVAWPAVTAVLLVTGAWLVSASPWTSSSSAAAGRDAGISPAQGALAPGFTLPDSEGRIFDLAEHRGKVVLLDFWATWCPPCVASLPHTDQLARSAGARRGELVVLAVNMQEQPDQVRAFIERHGYRFRTAIDENGDIAGRYQVQGIPSFVVIHRDGTVGWATSGFDPSATPRAMHAAIARALQEPGAAG